MYYFVGKIIVEENVHYFSMKAKIIAVHERERHLESQCRYVCYMISFIAERSDCV